MNKIENILSQHSLKIWPGCWPSWAEVFYCLDDQLVKAGKTCSAVNHYDLATGCEVQSKKLIPNHVGWNGSRFYMLACNHTKGTKMER